MKILLIVIGIVLLLFIFCSCRLASKCDEPLEHNFKDSKKN